VSREERAGLDDLIEMVRAQREELRPHMITYLADLEASGFRERFDRFVAGEE
jgi:hypothetical protein